MKHKVTRFGKEVKVDGRRWADCDSETKAQIVHAALVNYFLKRP